MAQEEELGGPIFEVQTSIDSIWKGKGATTWKTSDSSVDAKIKCLRELEPPTFLSEAVVCVTRKVGEPLRVVSAKHDYKPL
eukprot:10031625-Ditylum_brightwellii.AAC.1